MNKLQKELLVALIAMLTILALVCEAKTIQINGGGIWHKDTLKTAYFTSDGQNIMPILYKIPLAVKNESEQARETQNMQTVSRSGLTISDNGYLGKCRVTRYCPCEKCCGKYAKNRPTDENGIPVVTGASGKQLNSGYSCAADTSLPFGTKLYIPQIGLTVTVEDRAAKSIEQRYDGKFVDLYFTDHAHYIEGASDYMEVYIVN